MRIILFQIITVNALLSTCCRCTCITKDLRLSDAKHNLVICKCMQQQQQQQEIQPVNNNRTTIEIWEFSKHRNANKYKNAKPMVKITNNATTTNNWQTKEEELRTAQKQSKDYVGNNTKQQQKQWKNEKQMNNAVDEGMSGEQRDDDVEFNSFPAELKFVRPFGQLGEQWNEWQQMPLQQYTKLLQFNAEQQTKFHLYTLGHSEAKSAAARAAGGGGGGTMSDTNSGRVLNVIGAAFGVQRETMHFNDMLAANHGIKIELLQLHNATNLRQTRFNATMPTRLIIHGWLGGEHANVYRALIPAYLRQADGAYNVITVDWGRGAFADYLTASYRVKPVGKVVAKFVDFLRQEAGLRLAQLHVIGFSMGAHIAGICGKHVHSGRLSAIFALDPALPFFRYEQPEERLALTDADYVEVVHTSVGTYGYDRPLGHADFYVNYGSQQPGCLLYECSHFRAYEIFAAALSGEKLAGLGCMANYWQDMTRQRRCLMRTGKRLTMSADALSRRALKKRRGVYYLSTNAKAPFAQTAG